MSDKSREIYVQMFGTDEQKKELQERRDMFNKWFSQFPTTKLEDIMKLNSEVFYANL